MWANCVKNELTVPSLTFVGSLTGRTGQMGQLEGAGTKAK